MTIAVEMLTDLLLNNKLQLETVSPDNHVLTYQQNVSITAFPC